MRKNVGMYHAQIQGAGKLAVKVVMLGIDVAVAWSAVVVAFALHMRRCAQLFRVQHRIRRRSGNEDAGLEEREDEYSKSARIPHERRRRLHGDEVIPLKRSRTPARYGGPRETVKLAVESLLPRG